MADRDDRRDDDAPLDAADLDAIRRAMEGLRDSAPPPSAAPTDVEPKFPDLESWVNGFFVLTFTRSDDSVCWCAHWWDHPEAVLRLDALWRTWEAAALDPVHGMAVWIREHLDPNLGVLLGPRGPFAACREGRHVPPAVLPVAPAPPGWWSASHWWEMLTEGDR